MNYRGSIREIRYYNHRTSWCVLRVRIDGDDQSVTGVYHNPMKGDVVEIVGESSIHPKYGEQIAADVIHRVKPRGHSEMVTYLAHIVPGVGGITAAAIVDHFGVDRTVEAILEKPHELADVSGVGKVRAKAILEKLSAGNSKDPLRWLIEAGLTPAQAGSVLGEWDDPIERVEENPYVLIQIPRITFPVADHVAAHLGIAADDSRRLVACAEYVTEADAGYGNTWMPRLEAVRKISNLLGADEDVGQEAVDTALEEKVVVMWSGRLHSRLLWRYETTIADCVKQLVGRPAKMTIEAADEAYFQLGLTPSGGQLAGVRALSNGSFAVVTGLPGTGKTTIVQAIVRAAGALDLRVKLCAPTGKAAKRLSELSGAHAETVHKMLRVGSMDPVSDLNPLDADLVVVDEASMISAEIGAMLFEAIPQGAGMLVVGDVNQLPPVGPGAVLGDLIASGEVPVVRLDVIHRQAENSPIIQAAHLIHNSTDSVLTVERLRQLDHNFFQIITLEDPSAAHVVRKLQMEMSAALRRENGLSEIQLLAPMRKGDVGVTALNEILAEYVNPDDEYKRGVNLGGFLAGDKVMHIINNYKLGVLNGMTGVVTAADAEVVVVDYGDSLVKYDNISIGQVVLSFVTTGHKFQGSECPVVVIVAHPSHSRMLTRQWIYTAITRAKERCVVITAPGTLERAIANRTREARKTSLLDLLRLR